MEDAEKTALLKDEYLHLQNAIDAFDGRMLTIKAWSVTFSLVALTAAFASEVPAALLVASLSALLFWLIEGIWKTFQLAFYARNDEIETYFVGKIPGGKVPNVLPMQIGSSWYREWRYGNKTKLRRAMRMPHVALPHVIVFVVGLVLHAMYLAGVISV